MPGALTKLPVELHTAILNYLQAQCQDYNAERDAPILTLFPCNAASVCRLWRDILGKMLTPDRWKKVVFDVAHEPALLDAFSWTMNMKKIEVVVYNSSSGSGTDKGHEKRRVAAIVSALRPHMQRFKAIVFDVEYSSSLPPPNTFFLEEALFVELRLSSRIDDIDIRAETFGMTLDKSWPPFETYFPRLRVLSLTGFWFMYLALHVPDPGWFRELQETSWPLDLTVSHFTFLPHGNYTLEKLISLLSQLDLARISFRDLSLSPFHDAQSAPSTGTSHPKVSSIHFENVSRDFISHFYSLAPITVFHQLSFERCSIPTITDVLNVQTLKLKGIIDNDDDHSEGQASSLRHIISAWRGIHLIIDTCPSFDDALLAWMGSEIEFTSIGSSDSNPNKVYSAFPARGIVNLTIQDCSNFTPSALQQLVKKRNTVTPLPLTPAAENQGREQDAPIRHLSVFGKVPSLSEEDTRWFGGNSKDMVVNWKVMNDGAVQENFYLCHI
ncbi:hypothetical protein GALMADRAFT_774945 [Galerina marginata CBS 339.88]|uniref:F-box domain-containing protein n=1 Tax=Galerina marginata (strain CBS 339.88) TaxID=685588 RepID=A0A067SPY9_GALM3|nr:hypothetical protein GALMADRAFT_774945 [Galerina marginata CBS 339.88]